MTFNPLIMAIEDIERKDEVLTVGDVAAFCVAGQASGQAYAMGEAFMNLAEAYQIHEDRERRRGRQIDLGLKDLFLFGEKMDQSRQLVLSDLARAKQAIHKIWGETRLLSFDYMTEIIEIVRARDYAEDKGLLDKSINPIMD